MIIIIYIILAILVGVYSDKKNRTFKGGFILSLIISPLIAFIVLLAAGPQKEVNSEK